MAMPRTGAGRAGVGNRAVPFRPLPPLERQSVEPSTASGAVTTEPPPLEFVATATVGTALPTSARRVAACHAGVAARRRSESVRARRGPDPPHVAGGACARRSSPEPWTRLARRNRPRAVARAARAAAAERSSVAARDLGPPAAEGHPPARARSPGPRTASPSSCATSSRTSAAAIGSCRSPASSCAPLYWFNPLVWIACTRLRQESEQACDDEVLSSGVDGA